MASMNSEEKVQACLIFVLLVFIVGSFWMLRHHDDQKHQEVATCQQQGHPLAECRKAVE